MLAAQYNPNLEVIMILLKEGAKVKAIDATYHVTALMYAAAFNPNPDAITALLKAGADGKTKSLEGKTAFDNAQSNPNLKDTDAYRQLLEGSQ